MDGSYGCTRDCTNLGGYATDCRTFKHNPCTLAQYNQWQGMTKDMGFSDFRAEDVNWNKPIAWRGSGGCTLEDQSGCILGIEAGCVAAFPAPSAGAPYPHLETYPPIAPPFPPPHPARAARLARALPPLDAAPPLARSYAIVLGFGVFFTIFTVGLTWLEQKVVGAKTKGSEHFNTAGRNVKIGLTGSVIVSQWTWAATLLQSSNVAWNFGISGPFWYAAGATIQVLLFGILAIEIKRKCPNAHTMLEIVDARWGKARRRPPRPRPARRARSAPSPSLPPRPPSPVSPLPLGRWRT